MKKVLSYLFLAVLVGCLASMAVSCKKDNIRYQLNPVEVKNQEETLEINDRDLYLEHGRASLYATYRNGIGLLQPDKIRVTPGNVEATLDGDHAIFEFTVPGSYTVSAGKLSIGIIVLE